MLSFLLFGMFFYVALLSLRGVCIICNKKQTLDITNTHTHPIVPMRHIKHTFQKGVGRNLKNVALPTPVCLHKPIYVHVSILNMTVRGL